MKRFIRVFAAFLAASVLFSCNKEQSFSVNEEQVVSEPSRSPITKAYGDKTPVIAIYVETNDVNPLNAMDYYMDGEPFAELVEFFASNIHKTTVNNVVQPTLYLNDKLTPLLENDACLDYVAPITDNGQKPILTVLGDWAQLGVANMTTTQQDQFATILCWAVAKYGFAGIGFDDEYANYQESWWTLYNGSSWGNIINALRTKFDTYFPNEHKLITVFKYGLNVQQISNASAWGNVDYAYPNFGSPVPSPGVPVISKWAYFSVLLGSTYSNNDLDNITTWSSYAKNNGYGAIMGFNLRKISDQDPTPVFQAIADGAFNEDVVSCDDGDRDQDITPVTGGYTITYSEAVTGLASL